MAGNEPVTELHEGFSEPQAKPTPWAETRGRLAAAEVYWVTTVRPDGRPHVTPLLAVWLEEALHFCTGATERKARNLEGNPHCILTTGNNALHEGLDVVVEGDAVRVRDHARLQRLADAWESKYGSDWHFDVRDGAFEAEGNQALVFAVAPTKVWGFGKGSSYSQTRYRFDRG